MLRIACTLLGCALLAGTAQADDPPSRITAIYSLDADGNVSELASIADFPIINSPEISPDGKWIAVDGWKAGENLRDARILIVNVENGAVLDLGKGAMPSWSPDGKWIAFCKYGAERGVYIRSVDGATERLIDRNGWGIQWAPDGLKAAYTRSGTFVIYDFIGDTQQEIDPPDWPYRMIYWNCEWSNESDEICFLGRRPNGTQEIAILDLRGEKPRLRVRAEGNAFDPDIAWHPDGACVTIPKKSAPGEPGQIYIFDPNGFEPPKRLDGQPEDRANSGMCWSPDGSILIFLSRG